MSVTQFKSSLLGVVFLLAALTVSFAQGAPTKSATAAAKQKSSVQTQVAPPEKRTPPGGQQEDPAAADIKTIKKPPLPQFHPQLPKRRGRAGCRA